MTVCFWRLPLLQFICNNKLFEKLAPNRSVRAQIHQQRKICARMVVMRSTKKFKHLFKLDATRYSCVFTPSSEHV